MGPQSLFHQSSASTTCRNLTWDARAIDSMGSLIFCDFFRRTRARYDDALVGPDHHGRVHQRVTKSR